MARNLVAAGEFKRRHEDDISTSSGGKAADSSDADATIKSQPKTASGSSVVEFRAVKLRKRGKKRYSKKRSSAGSSSWAQTGCEDEVVNNQREFDQPVSERDRLLPHIQGLNYGTVSKEEESTNKMSRFRCIMLFLVVLILGMTFAVCSNLRTDFRGWDISPRVLKCYTIFLITVYIAWMVYDKILNRNATDGLSEESGSLIPSHLLTGLVLFGVGSSVCQTITIIDFIKCYRHQSMLDKSYAVYPFFEICFMFCQVYMFYTFSKDRERKMFFGNALVMFTLAVNLTIWATYFFAGAVNSKQLKHKTWLAHYYYGVLGNDTCSRVTIGNNNSRELHRFRGDMTPMSYTLAMENSLLASALLLHLWFGIARRSAGEYSAVKSKWVIWRASFIFGLFVLPLLATLAANSVPAPNEGTIFYVILGELALLILLFICGCFGLNHIKSDAFVDDNGGPLSIDLTLLYVSWFGFLVFDFFTMFASAAEVLKKFDDRALGLGFEALVEFLATGVQTVFLAKAYGRKIAPGLPKDQLKAPKRIRQICSFCVVVSFGFWAMRTYTFRSSETYDFIGERYFGRIAWFAITQLSVPLCMFYHFHSAVCFTEVLSKATY